MPRTISRRRATAVAVLAVTGLLAAGTTTASGTTRDDRATLMEYARDTWASFDAMTNPATGLPADNIEGNLDPTTSSSYTSPTNIGAYLWSTVVARDLSIITRDDALARLRTTLTTLASLDRHDPSGQFYNWYDPATGAKLTTWPADGSRVYPFLSTVDNAWLATALVLVGNAEPRVKAAAEAIRSTMDFGFYYDPVEKQMRGGFWDEQPADGAAVVGNYRGVGPDVWYTGHHYGTLNTEPRMASYLAIAWGQVPAEHYFHLFRTFPDACDWSWPEQRPVGTTRTYLGVPVYEGAYRYRGMQMVPSWGGSMFEALMVGLFVPEAQWGPTSWGVNHPLYVRAQIEHGMQEAGYGYWGFSPASDPAGGYREYGVDQIGMEPNGYTSDEERTTVDPGWDDPTCPRAASIPASFGDGVVTPHASFLALPYAKSAALDNLARIRTNLDGYGPGGFYDSVAVRSGMVAQRYLSLDQGMIMAAIGNELRNNAVQRYADRGPITEAIKPLLALETFSSSG
ncbi:MAG TPA: glucoamylase family protein [Actinotalea sp.]